MGVHMSSMESWLELGVEHSGGSDKERAHEVVEDDLTMADGRPKNFSRSACFPEYSSQNFDESRSGCLSGVSGLTPRTSQGFGTILSFVSVI